MAASTRSAHALDPAKSWRRGLLRSIAVLLVDTSPGAPLRVMWQSWQVAAPGEPATAKADCAHSL